MATKIGFIGLGHMGGPIARRLVTTGHDVTAFDLNAGALRSLTRLGARRGTSPRDVASRAELVFTCLPNLAAIEAVMMGKDGVCRGRRVKTVAELSTTGPHFAQRLGVALARHGIELLDSPVTGGTRRAAAGDVGVMVSGDSRTLASLRGIFDKIGKVVYVGEKPGLAQMMKLTNSVLSAVGTAAAYEAFVFGVKAGLDPDVMLEVINNGSGRNDATLNKLPRAVLTRTFDYGSNMEITYKDISLAMETAEKLGVPMLIGNSARQLWAYGANNGGAKRDSSTLITYLEKWAGVEVIGKAAAAARSAGKPARKRPRRAPSRGGRA